MLSEMEYSRCRQELVRRSHCPYLGSGELDGFDTARMGLAMIEAHNNQGQELNEGKRSQSRMPRRARGFQPRMPAPFRQP